MHKTLVPVDGSERALEAVRHVIKLIRDAQELDVHLLNVQPPLTGDVVAFVPHRAVHEFHLDEANRATRAACELLNRAGIAFTKHIVVGHAASVIAECARELHCDMVIMGTHGFPTITQVLLGSVSQQAIHLMDPRIAVTLVKAGHRTHRMSEKRIAP
jgi:nucleotide-binding universal stress UspA family protein